MSVVSYGTSPPIKPAQEALMMVDSPMRSRLESDPFYDSPFPRASSPYQLEGRVSTERRHHDQFYVHRPDDVESISDSYNGRITVSITPTQSPPPSPPSPASFISFNSSQSSGLDLFTLHPMSSSTSISSSRSMPVPPTRSAIDMYVYHNVKPTNTLSKKRKLKPKAILANHSSPRLDIESPKKGRYEETENLPTRLLRSSSISSSLRVFTGSLRRKSSTFLAAPAVTITPSTPTITSPVSPLSPISPPMSPLSPMEGPSESERRLRQLHKVSRTLGENIPAELIFGGAGSPEDAYAAPIRSKATTILPRSNRRASLSISSFTPFIIPTSDESNATDSIPSSPERPSSMAFEVEVDHPRPGSFAGILSPITFAPPTPQQPLHTLPDFPEEVSANGSPHSPSSPTSPEGNPILRMLSRPATPFFDSVVPVDTDKEMLDVNYGSVSRREKRQGWSGEWNRQDMQDVIAKLRTLK